MQIYDWNEAWLCGAERTDLVSLTLNPWFPQGHLSTLDVNQLYSNVNNFKPLYQKLLNVLVISRKLKETFQSGLGNDVLSIVLGKLEADMCSWVSSELKVLPSLKLCLKENAALYYYITSMWTTLNTYSIETILFYIYVPIRCSFATSSINLDWMKQPPLSTAPRRRYWSCNKEVRQFSHLWALCTTYYLLQITNRAHRIGYKATFSRLIPQQFETLSKLFIQLYEFKTLCMLILCIVPMKPHQNCMMNTCNSKDRKSCHHSTHEVIK